MKNSLWDILPLNLSFVELWDPKNRVWEVQLVYRKVVPRPFDPVEGWNLIPDGIYVLRAFSFTINGPFFLIPRSRRGIGRCASSRRIGQKTNCPNRTEIEGVDPKKNLPRRFRAHPNRPPTMLSGLGTSFRALSVPNICCEHRL